MFFFLVFFIRDKTVSSHRRCKAVYSYTQNNEDELTLGVDDIIEFLGEVSFDLFNFLVFTWFV